MATQFLKLDYGSNVIRIITNPFQYIAHNDLTIKGRSYHQQRVKCFAALNNEKCDHPSTLTPANSRWLSGVISRKDNSFYILDYGYDVFKHIAAFAKNPDWGDPAKYDIDLMVELGNRTPFMLLPSPDIGKIIRPPSELLEELKELSLPKSDRGECVQIDQTFDIDINNLI